MGGLFDSLTLGARSLSTYRKAIDVTGHNLANVNTPGYTRQRLAIQSVTTNTELGPTGAGAEGTRVVRIKNEYFNSQIQVETSVEGSVEARQSALQDALTSLQETIDRSGVTGTTTNGISQGLVDFFAAMQSLSTNPVSIPERQVALEKAQVLAVRFNQVDSRLGQLGENLSKNVTSEVGKVNALASEIAKLNSAITREEGISDGSANDLRDSRQLKLEELARLVKFDAAEQPTGAVNVVVSGVMLVDGSTVKNTLETFDPGDGAVQVRVAGQTDALNVLGGSIEGTISTRDNDISSLRAQVNALAENFISEVNKVHRDGFGLTGTTGSDFFTGSNAGDIRLNAELLGNPNLLQMSGAADETGNNSIAVALAQLGDAAHAALNGQTFSHRQAQIVSSLGQKVATSQRDFEDQKAVSGLIKNQRESVSGVSLDEEMANLVMFQKAFQASAKLISMTDEMLSTIIQM